MHVHLGQHRAGSAVSALWCTPVARGGLVAAIDPARERAVDGPGIVGDFAAGRRWSSCGIVSPRQLEECFPPLGCQYHPDFRRHASGLALRMTSMQRRLLRHPTDVEHAFVCPRGVHRSAADGNARDGRAVPARTRGRRHGDYDCNTRKRAAGRLTRAHFRPRARSIVEDKGALCGRLCLQFVLKGPLLVQRPLNMGAPQAIATTQQTRGARGHGHELAPARPERAPRGPDLHAGVGAGRRAR